MNYASPVTLAADADQSVTIYSGESQTSGKRCAKNLKELHAQTEKETVANGNVSPELQKKIDAATALCEKAVTEASRTKKRNDNFVTNTLNSALIAPNSSRINLDDVRAKLS